MTDQKKSGYFQAVKKEFKKVVWPDKKKLFQYTGIVIAISLLIALFCFVLDFVFRQLVHFIVK